jgi:hypothetical protein
LNATEVELVVNKIDQDGDGMVDLREFRSWLHGDQNNKDGSDAPSLQAMLLKAKLNARVAMVELKKQVESISSTSSGKKKQEVVHVNNGDLRSVPTQVIKTEIENRLRTAN